MANPKTVRADFFQVVMPKGFPKRFSEVLTDIAALKLISDRTRNIHGSYYQLSQLERTGRQWIGSLMKIRMDELPVVAELSGETRRLELREDQGLGDYTSFVYTELFGVIVVQRNFQAARPGTVEHFLGLLGGVDEVEFAAVLRPDALTKLNGMKIVRRLEVSLATPNPEVFQGIDDAVEDVLHASQRVGAAHIDLSMGMGHAKGSMNVGVVRKIARDLATRFKSKGADVQRIQIKGSQGFTDEPMETIDLLESRLVAEFKLETVDRNLIPDLVQRQLLLALQEHAEDLRAQFARKR